MKGKSSMHRTLLQGLAVVASAAVAMMVCGIGQASAAQLEPNHHGSAHLAVAAAHTAPADVAVGAGIGIGVGVDADIDLDVVIGVGISLTGLIGATLGSCGAAGAGSAHNHR